MRNKPGQDSVRVSLSPLSCVSPGQEDSQVSGSWKQSVGSVNNRINGDDSSIYVTVLSWGLNEKMHLKSQHNA